MNYNLRFLFMSILCLGIQYFGYSQNTNSETDSVFKPKGKLWGAVFGDFAFKSNSDALNRGIYQYSGVPLNTNMFQWRRIYLGYKYEISKKFTADFLISGENDYQAGVLGQTPNTVNPKTGSMVFGNNGDLLLNNKIAPFIKWANIRWHNIWKGTDLVIGQVNTPAIGITGRNAQTSEEVWEYRSIEKTVADLRGTPVYDMGVTLQGWFDETGNYGYDFMVGNGQAARPENDMYKWFYSDVYTKFFDKKLVIDLYQDYERLNWGVMSKGQKSVWYHDRNMTKLFAAWTTMKITIGFEGYINTILGDEKVIAKDSSINYKTNRTIGFSVFTRGSIFTNSKGENLLGFFARYDNFDPSGNLSSILNDKSIISYTSVSSYYDPTTKETFRVFGLDYTPIKNIHFMPNVWIYKYKSAVEATTITKNLNANISNIIGTDVVWRITFYYVYGK